MNTPFNYKTLSDSKKRANNYKEIKDRSKDYYFYLRAKKSDKKISDIKVNLDLLNGKLDTSTFYDNPPTVYLGKEKESVQIDYQDISHTPLVMQVSSAFKGEISKLGVVYNIKDESPIEPNSYKRKVDEELDPYVQKALQTKRQNALIKVMQSYGISDPFVDPETQQQILKEVDDIVNLTTPKGIKDFVENKISSPKVRGAQSILKTLTLPSRVKDEQIQALNFLMASGEIIFFCDIVNNEVVYESVNPMFFDWEGPMEEEWVQNSRICQRTFWLSPSDIIQKYSEYLSKKDIEALKQVYTGVGRPVAFDNPNNIRTRMVMLKGSEEPYLSRFKDNDINTIKGQKNFSSIVSDMLPEVDYENWTEGKIEVVHQVFREKRNIYKVIRVNKEGVKEEFYVSKEYYKDSNSDIEVLEIEIDEVWENTLILHSDVIHVKTQRYPYQYLDPKNPYKVNFPYVGKRIGTNKGTTKPFIYVDLGKSAQKDFDITIASIKHIMATDMGNVFLFFMNLKPDNVSWQDFIDAMRNLKLMITDPSNISNDGRELSLMKEVALTSAQEIANKLRVADMHQNMLYQSMLFNAERLGVISPYQTSSNKDSSLSASHNQTAVFVQDYLSVINESLNLLLNVGYFFFKSNPEKAQVILDDLSLIDLLKSPDTGYAYRGIRVVNSYDEIDTLKQIKNYALAFIQNSDNYLAIIDLIISRTESEVRDIMEIEMKRREKIVLQQNEQQQLIKKMEQDGLLQREQIKSQSEIEKTRMREESNLQRAYITRETFAMANDVNRDGVNDYLTGKILSEETKIKLKEMDMEIEREKLREKLRNS